MKVSANHYLVKDWLVENVGVDNFEYDFSTGEVEFFNAEDYTAFQLKFPPSAEGWAGFYAPYIPLQVHISGQGTNKVVVINSRYGNIII